MPAKDAGLIVIDSSGKEQKLPIWKIALGTRRLSWLAPPPEKPAPQKPKDPAPAKGKAGVKPRPQTGPEALEFRDDHSTNYVDGILTLVPLDRIRAIDYDADNQTASVRVAGDKPEADVVLAGTTRFKGSNKLTIEAEVDKGDLGVAELKFLGGVPKGGIRSLRFPAPKAADAPVGRLATVTAVDKFMNVQKVVDLQPLYQLADGSERLLPTLMFKKTLKLELAKVQKIHARAGDKPDETEWTVTLKGEEEQTLSLLRAITLDDQQATLTGLLGRIPAGYKLFPVHTIDAIQFDEGKE